MSEKIMSFEEWWNGFDLPPEITTAKLVTKEAKIIWNAARLGTIPAENAIVVPEVWEKGATGIVWFQSFLYEDQLRSLVSIEPKNINFIPRPVPQWTPNVGESVFVNPNPMNAGLVRVGKISRIVDHGSPCKFYYFDGVEDACWLIENIKQFDASKIGLPWDQI